jgi:hypothetical protein
MEKKFTNWILVAGTGRYHLKESELLLSKEIGTAIAKGNFGLVVGGWRGVDYVVADSFAKELNNQKKRLSDYLIQVIPAGKEPEFKGGHIVEVNAGLKEWTESVSYADAVILIGGIGGTYETYLYANQEQKPTFPIAGTEGDARKVFNDILEHSTTEFIEGIPRETFTNLLQRHINSQPDAFEISNELILNIQDLLVQNQPAIFISYSHKDKKWLNKLRIMLKPLERQRIIIWDDTSIEAGADWFEEISSALKSSRIAIFLVSPYFVASEFISNHELPPLLQAAKNSTTKILWLLLSSCLYEETGLEPLQAAHDINKPLDRLNPARQNEVLTEIARKIRSYVQ